MELERVGPRLTRAAAAAAAAAAALAGTEWRAHVEQTTRHEAAIQRELPAAQGHMRAIAAQVAEAVEKVRARERSLSGHFGAVRAEHEEGGGRLRAAREARTATQSSVGALAGSVGSLQEQLDELREDVEGARGRSHGLEFPRQDEVGGGEPRRRGQGA